MIGAALRDRARALPASRSIGTPDVTSPPISFEDSRRLTGASRHFAGCGAVLEAVEKQPHLLLSGLMTVPPASDDAEAARPYFEQLVDLQRAHGGASRLPELSMGMSHDMEVAVACGATCVRVGTALYGAR